MHPQEMMINSRPGLEQGREVFAVPAMARSTRSKGTHRLIKQGAKLVEDTEDIPEEIWPLIRSAQSLLPMLDSSHDGEGKFGGSPACPQGMEKPARPEEIIPLRIVDKIPKHIDDIAQEAKMPVRRIAAILLELELRGLSPSCRESMLFLDCN